MREFERFNTVCANAYVKPAIKAYLERLRSALQALGVNCPVFVMHSGGGIISVETAAEFPVRLVESGPAGGAIFAADIARRHGLDAVLSFDMGGTTAKICLIEDQVPKTATRFEVARTYRFRKGSGMPISIPVVEMVEIGAGGGSIAGVDALQQIRVGPQSAGSRARPRLLPARRHAADRHRCRPRARPHRPRQFRRRQHAAVDGARDRGPGCGDRRQPWHGRHHRRLRHLRDGRREHGQCRPCPRRRERQGTSPTSR